MGVVCRASSLRLVRWQTCPVASPVRGSATHMHLGAADACTRMHSRNPDGTEEVFHPSVASLVHVD